MTVIFSLDPALWLTRVAPAPIDGDTSIIVFTNYEQLNGKTWPKAELVALLNKFDLLNLLKFTSTLGLTLECDSGSYSTEYQVKLAEKLLPRELASKYKFLQGIRAAIAKTRKRKFNISPLVTPLHVLNFLKHAIVNHAGTVDLGHCDKFSMELAQEAFMLLLAFGAHLESAATTPLNFEEESKQAIKELTRATILLGSEPAKRLICRYFRMCFEISKTAKKEQELEVFPTLFEDATGISLAKYFSVGLATLCKFSNVSLLEVTSQEHLPISDHITMNWKAFFAATALTDAEKEVAERAFCGNLLDTREAFQSLTDDSGKSKLEKSFEYDLLPFIQRPMIELGSDISIPSHLPFILEKFTASLYWPVADSLKDPMKGHFSHYWGNITQMYVEEIFKGDIVPFSTIKRSGVFYDPSYNLRGLPRSGSDIIIYDHKLAELFLFEVTYSGLRVETGSLTDNLQALSAGMDKLIEKARQINTVIKDLKNGDLALSGIEVNKIKKFRPFIITLQPYPLWNFLWQSCPDVWSGLYQRLTRRELLQDEDVAELRILSVSEIENLGALQRAKYDSLGILRDWPQDKRWGMEPLRNYLHFHFRSKGNFAFTDELYSKAYRLTQHTLFPDDKAESEQQ
jgi:hypothetical protein